MAERVRMYKTADGKLFDDRAAMKRHEAWLELVEICTVWTSDQGTACEPGNLLAEYLLLNASDIARILRAKPERAE